MKRGHTRAITMAALTGKLEAVRFHSILIFGVAVPGAVPNVPVEILDPRRTWANPEAYDRTAADLAQKFVNNFQKYADYANEQILAGAPKVAVEA